MGWTSYHVEPGTTVKQALAEEFRSDAYRILDVAVKGSVAYLAVRERDSDSVFAMVVLTQRNSREHFNFSYKDMGEEMGPNEADCPKRILDLLTPTDKEYAIEWRAACYANLSRAAVAKQVRAGDVIVLDEPVRFTDGVERQRFTFVARSTFRTDDDKQVRLTNWRKRPFSIEFVNAPAGV